MYSGSAPKREISNQPQGRSGAKVKILKKNIGANPTSGGGINRATKGKSG
jgi:hypothetical protein